MQLPMRAICVFHAAAKAGSISKAAAELNVTPSAVTQQIQLLELQLGTSLMVKVGRRIALTEAGERYFTSIRDEVERITEATDQIRGFRSLMALNVRATPTLSAKWLLPRLGSLIDLHSDLEPDSKAYARAMRLIPNWIAAKVTKAARVSARFS